MDWFQAARPKPLNWLCNIVKITVANWAHRTVRSQKNFVDARDDDTITKKYAWVGVPVVGVYHNPRDVIPSEIILTEEFMLLRSGTDYSKLRFCDVSAIHAPPKGSGGRIHIERQNMSQMVLVVAGGEGKFEDVFEFVRFLSRVIESKLEGRHAAAP